MSNETLNEREICAVLRVGEADLERCKADPLFPSSLTRANLEYWKKRRLVSVAEAYGLLGINGRMFRRLSDLDRRLPHPIIRRSGPSVFVRAELEKYQEDLV